MTKMTPVIKRYPDTDALAQAVVDLFVEIANDAIEARDVFTVALSGGTTPRSVYELLASEQYAEAVDWSMVHVFWGDERSVPPNNPNSNYWMAENLWLGKGNIPEINVHRMKGELEADLAEKDYTRVLRDFFAESAASGEPPRLDLVFLGMGDDGHTASLFPGTEAIHETERWVTAHFVEKLDTWRITLTPVVLNAAANVAFLVEGEGKAERLKEVLEGPQQPDVLPAQIIAPEDGNLYWFVDEEAAADL
ncbi:MAG: 6-phosphogluconolactonase [Anaerolineales bacterium]|nr:6-phosphogluconolactonase [Anaerolineales bacterium]